MSIHKFVVTPETIHEYPELEKYKWVFDLKVYEASPRGDGNGFITWTPKVLRFNGVESEGGVLANILLHSNGNNSPKTQPMTCFMALFPIVELNF